MADPTRLYSPNPNAPQFAGAPDTPQPSILDRLLKTSPSILDAIWGALPQQARQSYASVPSALGELSPGAAVRDTLDASGNMVKSALSGDGWGTAGAGANMLTAMAGVIPGGRAVSKVAGEAPSLIRAYHGSPHNFDRFDAGKIGTGEGAQAYGHGLYFAENEGVAKSYRDQLSGKTYTPEWMKLYQQETALKGEMTRLDRLIQDESAALGAKGMPGWGTIGARHSDVERKYAPELNRIDAELSGVRRAMSGVPQTIDNPGSMYEVNINADPARFLDWDKPLTAQPPEIVSSLEQNAGRFNAPLPWTGKAASPVQSGTLGAQFYNDLSDRRGAGYASSALQESGIPGIKYLDGGSRTAGQGSSNYVIFPGQEHLIDIVRKYGMVPVTAAGAVIGGSALAPDTSAAPASNPAPLSPFAQHMGGPIAAP